MPDEPQPINGTLYVMQDDGTEKHYTVTDGMLADDKAWIRIDSLKGFPLKSSLHKDVSIGYVLNDQQEPTNA